jgi:hypothetical protein
MRAILVGINATTLISVGRKYEMKTITISDIKSWKPCFDPSKYLPENWSGTVLDILRDDRISASDKLWLLNKGDLVSENVINKLQKWSYIQQIKSILQVGDAEYIKEFNTEKIMALCENEKLTVLELSNLWMETRQIERRVINKRFLLREVEKKDKLIDLILQENKINE